MTVEAMRSLADSLGRVLVRRTTLYAQETGERLLRRGERQRSPFIEA
jgi:hypothetical protein